MIQDGTRSVRCASRCASHVIVHATLAESENTAPTRCLPDRRLKRKRLQTVRSPLISRRSFEAQGMNIGGPSSEMVVVNTKQVENALRK